MQRQWTVGELCGHWAERLPPPRGAFSESVRSPAPTAAGR